MPDNAAKGGALADLDLNLLIALRVLLREEHVSKAADELGMSQPAMSRALSKLREMFNDPLLVRSGRGVQRTERARELQPQLERLFGQVDEILNPGPFDPSTVKGRLRIAAPDLAAYMLVPPLLQRIVRDAPRVDITVVQLDVGWAEKLERGAFDIAVGATAEVPAGIHHLSLWENRWACVLRQGHPALWQRWSAEVYDSLDHMLVTMPEHEIDYVSPELLSRIPQNRIVLRVPYTTLTPLLVAETDLVLTTARWLASKLLSTEKVVVKWPPFDIAPAAFSMFWHDRSHDNPFHAWIRGIIAEIAAGFEVPFETRRKQDKATQKAGKD